MGIKIIEKPTFYVLGKAKTGLTKESYLWIPPLWESLQNSFSSIKDLILKDAKGKPQGIWGVMSDDTHSYLPWRNVAAMFDPCIKLSGEIYGMYIAGYEAKSGIHVPKGWDYWRVPAFKYATIECDTDHYSDMLKYMLFTYLKEKDYTLAGAIHEYYKNNKMFLYVPIAKL